MKPRVSVLIIIYNQERFLRQAVDSALMQQASFGYEIVIGEDCSRDGSAAILEEYKRKYPDRIRVFFNERNLGANRNFVKTYGECRGEYVALLEGDDYWINPDKLQKQVEFLDVHQECSMCFHNARVTYEDNERDDRDFRSPGQKQHLKLEDLFEGNLISPSSAMFRKGLFDCFPEWFYDLYFGDWTLHILNAQHGDIEYLDQLMSVYRIHGSGISRSRKQITLSKVKLYDYLDEHFNHKYSPVLDRWKKFYEDELYAEYLKDSLQSLNDAARVNPDDRNIGHYINGILAEGEKIITKGDRTRSYSIVHEIIGRDSDNALAYLSLGILNYLDGQGEKALGNLDRARELYRRTTDSVDKTGQRLTGLLNIVKYYRKSGATAKAEELFAEILSDISQYNGLSSHFEALSGLGSMCLAEKKYEDSVGYYSAAVKIDGISDRDKFHACFELGRAFYNLHDHRSAEHYYRRALSTDGIAPEMKAVIVLEIGICYSAMDRKDMEEQEYLALLSDNDLTGIWKFRVLNRLGDIYYRLGKHDLAESRFQEALSIENIPEEDRYHALLGHGRCYRVKGEHGIAEEKIKEAFSYAGISDEIKLKIANELLDCCLNQGKLQMVEDICGKVLTFNGITDQQKRGLIARVKENINSLKTKCRGIHA